MLWIPVFSAVDASLFLKNVSSLLDLDGETRWKLLHWYRFWSCFWLHRWPARISSFLWTAVTSTTTTTVNPVESTPSIPSEPRLLCRYNTTDTSWKPESAWQREGFGSEDDQRPARFWRVCLCVQVYCDMEARGGRWTVSIWTGLVWFLLRASFTWFPSFVSPQVFQSRIDGSVNFYRPWDHYKTGFGSAATEFWLGETWTLTPKRVFGR